MLAEPAAAVAECVSRVAWLAYVNMPNVHVRSLRFV